MMYEKILKLYDSTCLKTAGILGTGIHLYSTLLNNQHINGILDDFSNERYGQGILKAAFPYVLPYAVSLYSRRRAQKEVQGKINDLESQIAKLSK
jgi:hypothetical protein